MSKLPKLPYKTIHEIVKSIREQLTAARHAAHLSLDELAELAGVSPLTIRNLESKGCANLTTIIRAASALNLCIEIKIYDPRDELSDVYLDERDELTNLD